MRSILLVTMIVALPVSASAQRNTPACRAAVDQYNAIVQEVSGQLQRYTACVTSSRGRSDCGGEFSRLRSAQGDFEDAVNAMRDQCQ